MLAVVVDGAPGARTAVVLLVDDQPLVLRAFAGLLERKMGARVVTATSAAAAWAVLASERVDVVLADYRMPDEDGLSLLQRVAAAYPDVRRVLFTAYAEKGSIARALEDGTVQKVLAKDLDPERVLSFMRDLVRSAA